jgi:hypothetical protein
VDARAYAAALPSTSRRISISCTTSPSANTGHAERVEIGEWGCVKQSRVHDAACRQVIDDHVDEFMLMGRKLAALAEPV